MANMSGPGSGKMDKETMYATTWSNSKWNPLSLNACNILDYFGDRSNPFYERDCNNEIIKMQRLHPDQLFNMTSGIEYVLLFCQEPLFVIRKNHRQSPSQVIPLALYYVINGVVYQAPDLAAVINSRLVNTVNYLQNAFHETYSYARFHPFRGYSWEFNNSEGGSSDGQVVAKKQKLNSDEEPKSEQSTSYQRQNADMLMANWLHKYPLLPPPTFQQPANAPQSQIAVATSQTATTTTTEVTTSLASQVKPERTSPVDKK